MTEPHSDALVFYGATGDLAYKKIFPALHAMVKRGHLDNKIEVIWIKRYLDADRSFIMRNRQSWREMDPQWSGYDHRGGQPLDAPEDIGFADTIFSDQLSMSVLSFQHSTPFEMG